MAEKMIGYRLLNGNVVPLPDGFILGKISFDDLPLIV